VDEAVGVDVSAEMLAVAKEKNLAAELHHADITEEDILEDRQFELITAFRFFPNAEPDLRQSAMAVLVRHLSPHGVLVFNNHRNEASLLELVSKWTGKLGRPGVSDGEMRAIYEGAGLRLAGQFGIGLVPISERRLQWLVPVISPLERIAAAFNTPLTRRYCQDIIYVCRRAQ